MIQRVRCSELALHHDPLIARSRDQTGAPEELIELDDRQPRKFTETASSGRFAGSAAAQDNHAFHRRTVPDHRHPSHSHPRSQLNSYGHGCNGRPVTRSGRIGVR